MSAEPVPPVTDNDRDAQTIREALTRTYVGSSGGWKVPWDSAQDALAALARLVAALSVATTERDEARQQLAKFHEDAAYTANVVGRVADAAVDAWHERAEALAVQLPTYLPPWLLPLPRRPLNEPEPKSRHQSGRESASGELKDAQQTGAVAALVAQLQQARKGLQFYADIRHLHREWSGEWQKRDHDGQRYGAHARQVLATLAAAAPAATLNEPEPKSRHQSGRESASGELKDAQQTGAVATSGAESSGSLSAAAAAAPNETEQT